MSRQTKEYAKKLVAQMTVEEKMSQMLYESPAIERLNIPAYNWWNEALHRSCYGISTVDRTCGDIRSKTCRTDR